MQGMPTSMHPKYIITFLNMPFTQVAPLTLQVTLLRKLFFAFFTLEVHLVDFNFCEVFLERFLIDLGCATGHRSYFLIIAELMVTFRALIYYFTLRVLTIISVLYLLIMIYLCLKRNSHFVFSKQLLCHYFNLPMQRLNQHLLLLQIIS